MNDLIINGIDHSVFDLEWAKRGGVVYHYGDFCRYICDGENYNEIRAGQDGEFLIGEEKTVGLVSILTAEKVENSPYYLRMATPYECDAAGVYYIEPPATKGRTMKHTMSMYQTKDEMIEAMQVEIDLLEAQLAESRELRNGFANLISDFQLEQKTQLAESRELRNGFANLISDFQLEQKTQLAESRELRNGFANLISDFQELNLGDYFANYTDDDVRRMNDWAIESYAAMKKGE